MHDPHVLVFEFLGIEVWHCDPETDGSDDSCGYSTPRLTKSEMGELRFLARQESHHPWFQKSETKSIQSAAEAVCLLTGAYINAAKTLRLNVPFEKLQERAYRFVHCPLDNFRSMLAFKPGYHSNRPEDWECDREQAMTELYICCARGLKRDARPWYRHPKFHFWHWQFRCHWLRRLLTKSPS